MGGGARRDPEQEDLPRHSPQEVLSPSPSQAPQDRVRSVQSAGDASEASWKRWHLSRIRKPAEEFSSWRSKDSDSCNYF